MACYALEAQPAKGINHRFLLGIDAYKRNNTLYINNLDSFRWKQLKVNVYVYIRNLAP